MTKKKLQRFKELKEFSNSFEPSLEEVKTGSYYMKGKWHDQYFKNNNPIILELGCGKGEYTTGLANIYPEKNFIGIDIKGARMWRGAKTAIDNQQENVAFIRSRIDFIACFFAPSEVDEIWLTFPDPQLRKSRSKNRLSSPFFLARYQTFLQPTGKIHLKTDSIELFEFTLSVIKENHYPLLISTNDLYGEIVNISETNTSLSNCNIEKQTLHIQTFYETMFLNEGKKICYLQFQLQ